MKKLYIFIIAVIPALWSTAQINITLADLPRAGYTYFTATDTTCNILLGSPSASSQHWDFTTLTPDYSSSPSFDLTANTAYAAAFAASNIHTFGPAALFGGFFGTAPVNLVGMSTGNMFWKTDSSGYWIVGFRAETGVFSNTNVFENPMELLIGTPCTYSNAFNNNSRWELPVSNSHPADADTFYVNTNSKTLVADAFGSLTTPFSNYPNILRIHETLVRVDSSYLKLAGVTIFSIELYRDTSNNYIYLANGINYPAAKVHADKYNVVQSAEYYLGYLPYIGIDENPITKDEHSSVFPNPTNGKFQLAVSGMNIRSVAVYDILGKNIFTSTDFDAVTTPNIDLSFASKGIYFVRFLTDDATKFRTEKIVIE
jgi:hypothetical protein